MTFLPFGGEISSLSLVNELIHDGFGVFWDILVILEVWGGGGGAYFGNFRFFEVFLAIL